MAEAIILVKGYTARKSSCSTITLIKDKKINMIVDPGALINPKILIKALNKQNLKPKDINYICITHSHVDHYRNIGLFPNAKILDYFGIWEKDKLYKYNKNFTKDIEIIKTPGHNYDCITLLVKTDKGIIAIAGDVFWKKDFPKQDPYAADKEKLKKSRQLILKKADFIIPGHEDIYEVK